MKLKYEGYWTGSIFGTNQGGFILDLKQQNDQLSGLAKMHEPAIGQYEYHVTGEVAAPLTLDLMPGRIHGLIELGRVKAVCSLNAKGDLEEIGRAACRERVCQYV